MSLSLNRFVPRLMAGAILVTALLPALSSAAQTQTAPVQVQSPWVRWMPANLPDAAYLKLVNDSSSDVVLTGATSPDYEMVHLHQSYETKSGASAMRMVKKLRIPAGGSVELKPGGYHLMLMRPWRPIRPGTAIRVVLKFADGRSVEFSAPVKPANYSP